MILFRQETLNGNRDRLSGDVAVAVPISWQVITFLILGALVTALLFLSLATYSRVESVDGLIRPDVGIAQAVATRAGVVADLTVEDGQVVSQWTPLVTIRAEEDGAKAQTPGALVEAAISRQDASLALQSSASLAAAEAQIAQLAAQQAGLTAEIDQLRLQKEAQASLITTAEGDLKRATEIASRGFISKRDLQVREETLLSRQQGMAQLDQALAAKSLTQKFM